MEDKLSFIDGLKRGIPVCLAYIAVSFTFGMLAVRDGLPIWLATVISGTNLTSAGQFAGINMIAAYAGYLEIALAVFIINSRYILMSLSLSQQISENIGTAKRLFMSFFVTDEIFALASAAQNKLSFRYFLGLCATPYLGWTIGTLLGALTNSMLPENLQNAMGIALYCMFIAIIVPPAKKSRPILLCIALAVALSCALYFIPVINRLSFGFRVIISSVAAAGLTAVLCPSPEADPTPPAETHEAEADDSSGRKQEDKP